MDKGLRMHGDLRASEAPVAAMAAIAISRTAMLVGLLLMLCIGCASRAAPADAATAPLNTGDSVDYSCERDDQCVVKDVGNCCGYYPACVNVDSPTFPDQVKAECAREGTAGVCGFPQIDACRCVDQRCEPAGHGGQGLPLD